MTYRNIIFANDEIYHVFNKSVDNKLIFSAYDNLYRGLSITDFYRYCSSIRYSHFIRMLDSVKNEFYDNLCKHEAIVEILTFSLMPNHFHFLLKQNVDNGISKFLSLWQNSFARYFNIKNNRKGSLFCEMFKAVRIESREQLIHTSRYIHLNHVTAYLINIDKLSHYPYTSFCHYMGNINYKFVNSDIVLGEFRNILQYKKFVYNQMDYQRKLKKISNIILD